MLFSQITDLQIIGLQTVSFCVFQARGWGGWGCLTLYLGVLNPSQSTLYQNCLVSFYPFFYFPLTLNFLITIINISLDNYYSSFSFYNLYIFICIHFFSNTV